MNSGNGQKPVVAPLLPMFEPWPEASPSAAGDLCLPDHAQGLRKDRGPTASCSDGLETLLSGKM